ncbi:MAG: tRNA dimethylallyltransferase [Gaiellaceae bacterium]|nr:tRNA dimethylallyltransferase [Gaiellaceae bacterium]
MSPRGTADVVAIFGPTGSGKTAVAEAVADATGGEVVSCDSMQAYRGLPILTNQPVRPTRLVGVWPLDHEGSVAEFADLAHAAVDELLSSGRTPVLAGGTGLYLRAAIGELDLPPKVAPEIRGRAQALYGRVGPERAHELLAARDPAAAAAVHPNDWRRVVRALELLDVGASLHPTEARLWSERARHPSVVFGLDVPREMLDERIRARAHAMLEAGVIDEVRRALGAPISSTASRALGLRELVELPQEDALEALVARTQRYAAYQRKWMRRIPGLVSVAADRPADEVADELLEVARARQHLPAGRAR